MRTSRLAAFAALGLALTLAACDTSAPPPQRVNLLPLEVGNQWVMTYTMTDTTGFLYQSRTDTLGVSRDTVVSGERWYRVGLLRQTPDFGPLQGFFANRDDGLYRLVRGGDGRLTPSLYYSTVAEPGEAYPIAVGYREGITETAMMTLLSVDAPAEVPGAGTVPTYHYRRTTTSMEIEGYNEPIDVEGLTSDIRLSPVHGPVQQQSISVFERVRLDWRLQGGAPRVSGRQA